MASLFSTFDQQQAWPWQCLGQALAMLGKPAGGERTAALIDFCIRLWCRCRRPMAAAWCEQWQGHWDRAVAGSSALRAALLRKLPIELDIQDGLFWVLIMFRSLRFSISKKCNFSRKQPPEATAKTTWKASDETEMNQ